MFSPGNLRATFDNPEYEKLISYWVGEKYTLRYTGGMVPDVFQVRNTYPKLQTAILFRVHICDSRWKKSVRFCQDRCAHMSLLCLKPRLSGLCDVELWTWYDLT